VVQDGDLGVWEQRRILLVLEDTLAHVTGHNEGRIRRTWAPNPADEWVWGLTTVKTIMRYAFNSVPVEVVTFISTDVAALAADWFLRYDIDVSEVTYLDFGHFTKSLLWRRNNIQEIIDTNQERLLRYGQLGRAILFDGEF
jgi:hypothetical protein